MVRNVRNTRVTAARATREANDVLYLGEWLEALGVRPAKLAGETGINEGYLSELISRKKTNPSREKLRLIGDALEIDWRLLFEPPPTAAARAGMSKYGPDLITRLNRAGRHS